MKIEPKISGWAISDFNINLSELFPNDYVTLLDIDKLSKRSAQWILDHYNLVAFKKELVGCHYGVLMDTDDMCKVAIMENYPELEQELADYFNPSFGDWRKCYLRFGH